MWIKTAQKHANNDMYKNYYEKEKMSKQYHPLFTPLNLFIHAQLGSSTHFYKSIHHHTLYCMSFSAFFFSFIVINEKDFFCS